MSDNNLRQQKLDMWRKKLDQLEKDLTETMARRGEAARDGDLRENAAYKQATEDAEMIRARIAEINKIITDLEAEEGAQTRNA